MRTEGLNAIGTGLEHLDNTTLVVSSVHTEPTGHDDFARQGPIDELGFAIQPGDTAPLMTEGLYRQLNWRRVRLSS
ncbi:hypothetical protein GCM10022278_36740 [Allohahella marinimesophila]|uniref:Uncharacterized protein n=1 Tax=Allohahella marinimesophila TaxID=1054972 RepID=A0ABP7Q4S6_9GAMM